MTTRIIRSTAAVLAALVSAAAYAGPVVNGGFETGDFSGWTLVGDTSFDGVDPFAAQSGGFGAFFGSETASGISQAITLSAGTYTVSFMLQLDDSAVPNSFSWSWNGVVQTPVFTDTGGFAYQAFTAQVTALDGQSTLAFSFTNPQSFWLLDNVDVTAAATVPEPSSLLLAGGGLLMLLAARRKARGG